MSSNNDNKKEELKSLVIDALTEEFKKPSSQEHETVRAFSKGLEEDQELELTILTGGLCNYSYKLQFKTKDSNTKNDSAALFVKLTFGSPVAFPDTPCSPERTKYEFKMMDLFAKITPYPESAVMPYLCFDLEGSEENMTLLVTEFSSRLEEQAGNLFVDGGSIDRSYADKIAKSISALHNTEVTEPDFNKGMKEFFINMTKLARMIFGAYLDEADEQPDRASLRARAIGKESLDEMMEVYCKQLMRTDCYIHGDCQAFNILVEGNLKALANEYESSVGDVAVIDWEFSHVGPLGKDIGFAQCFPMACLLAHAINGDEASSKSILEFFDTLWQTYSASINLENKDLSLVDLYRQTIGFLGVMLQTYSGMGIHMDYLPLEEGNVEDLTKVKESLGVLALECYEIGWLCRPGDATVEELRTRFSDAIQKEMDHLAPAPMSETEPRRPSARRSSILRTTGCRVSDAHSYFSIATDVGASVASEFETEEFESIAKAFASNEEFKALNWGSDVVDNRTTPAMSRKARQSLAIVDLARRSVSEWDRMIVDFDFDEEDDEEEDEE
jgi:hypothetical protein